MGGVRRIRFQVVVKGGSHISVRWVSCGSFNLVELKIGDVGFCRERKSMEVGEKPLEKARTKSKFNLHMTPDLNRIRATMVGGDRSHHCAILASHCAIPAPQVKSSRIQHHFLLMWLCLKINTFLHVKI